MTPKLVNLNRAGWYEPTPEAEAQMTWRRLQPAEAAEYAEMTDSWRQAYLFAAKTGKLVHPVLKITMMEFEPSKKSRKLFNFLANYAGAHSRHAQKIAHNAPEAAVHPDLEGMQDPAQPAPDLFPIMDENSS